MIWPDLSGFFITPRLILQSLHRLHIIIAFNVFLAFFAFSCFSPRKSIKSRSGRKADKERNASQISLMAKCKFKSREAGFSREPMVMKRHDNKYLKFPFINCMKFIHKRHFRCDKLNNFQIFLSCRSHNSLTEISEEIEPNELMKMSWFEFTRHVNDAFDAGVTRLFINLFPSSISCCLLWTSS